ncbi:envelope glycoprotein M [Common bottlenose dolphin gammaherpesvirus 1 strain Sarasota]|uniref:Envelope glycoprotein M n=1 Tax=Common bottlenose dolphin gammaherpesvirus 1 strain Sarasota TaxID=2022783 RepID=A0A1Z1NEF8_9GAMA|nr:envelope glycoprotein M [Common bottlenose dolphin gammaherpesvirus 1 strain Sarasota]ARW78102.1 envelope glycoprotein M [Common bottlenose dolphin gammaherpesvirus 1 strain Sarasota]
MKSSKNDVFIYGIWLKLLILYFVMFISSIVVPIVAMFPNFGFPCYFNKLVDYGAWKLSEKNVAQHLTPTLFLEAPEMFFYITFVFFTDFLSTVYFVTAAVAVTLARKHIDGLLVLSQWIGSVGSPTIVYIGLLKLWTIQLFIHVLSYKHIYLAAFVYVFHFVLSIIYNYFYITHAETTWSFKMASKTVPKNTMLGNLLRYFKPITTNMHLACLALDTLVFCLSFMMAIGNSFYSFVSDIVIGSINLFLGLTLLWYVFTELWLHKYQKYQFGFYVGVAGASIILTLPLVRYNDIFVAVNLHQLIALNIAAIPCAALFAALVRMIRIYLGLKSRGYAPLESKETPGPKNGDQPPHPYQKSAIMIGYQSDEETDIF